MSFILSPIGNDTVYTDVNGNPYAGAKLFVYLAGSSTKTTTYKDNAGAASNTNPIILGADGRAPFPVWLASGLSYKFVLAPSGDTDPPASPYGSPWPYDNVQGINEPTASTTDTQWVTGPTPAYVSGTSFSVAGDQTSIFHVGRRLKLTDSGGNKYATIATTAYTSSTIVTLVLDSGSLDSGLSAVSYSILSASNTAVPAEKPNYITPAQITANQNNYDPTGNAGASVMRLSTDASRNITGLAGGSDGRRVMLMNVGSFPLVLKKEDAASTAANRFAFSSDVTLEVSTSVAIWYDGTSSRWRVSAGSETVPLGVNNLTISTPARSANTNYTNSTGRNMLVTVAAYGSGQDNQLFELKIENASPPTVVRSNCYADFASIQAVPTMTGIVPAGWTYRISTTATTPVLLVTEYY